MHVTSQLNYSTITLSSEKIHSEKQNNFVIYLFILAKVAAKWQLLTLLFRKSEGDNKSQICDFSRYFSRKGKNLVANATVLVAISSPVHLQRQKEVSFKIPPFVVDPISLCLE